MWGISWNNLMLFIADLPQYDFDSRDKKEETIEGDELETADDFKDFLG